ncbi:hypothetical protein [Tessaracoccus sp.]
MVDITDTVVSVLPILFLMGVGMLLRVTNVVDDAGIDTLKALVVNVVLPAVLFTAFLGIDFLTEYLAILVIIPAVCLLLLALGHLAQRLLPGHSEVTPYLFTGFEFGMVGIALFTAAYGVAAVPVAGMVGLGHEFFIWFVFVTLLRRRMEGAVSAAATVRSFVSSPVIIAIAAGLLLNVSGMGPLLERNLVGAALLQTLSYLAAVIVPVILIVVGYGTRLTVSGMTQAAPLVAARLAVTLPLALLLNHFVIGGWLGLPPIVEAAVFTLLILPPPFIVPIFLPRERMREIVYSNNVLSLHTVLSLAALVTYVAVT